MGKEYEVVHIKGCLSIPKHNLKTKFNVTYRRKNAN
jgi:hypothetical protein